MVFSFVAGNQGRPIMRPKPTATAILMRYCGIMYTRSRKATCLGDTPVQLDLGMEMSARSKEMRKV